MEIPYCDQLDAEFEMLSVAYKIESNNFSFFNDMLSAKWSLELAKYGQLHDIKRYKITAVNPFEYVETNASKMSFFSRKGSTTLLNHYCS